LHLILADYLAVSTCKRAHTHVHGFQLANGHRPHFARTFRSFVGEDGNLSIDITDSFPVRRAHALEVDRKRVLEAQLAAEVSSCF
jgi:hypothetical protein